MPRAAWLRLAFWHSLHAAVATASHDRKGLERLCRYLSRPPIPQDRLERRGDGEYVLSLERIHCGARGAAPVGSRPSCSRRDLPPWTRDDARVAALVPAPQLALRRFHGLLGPNHHLRSVIVPTAAADSGVPVARKRPGV